jgi:hypothetical protein
VTDPGFERREGTARPRSDSASPGLFRAAAECVAAGDVAAAVGGALAQPGRLSSERRAVAEQLFYRPGTATARAVACIYELLPLQAPASCSALASLQADPSMKMAPAFSGYEVRTSHRA